MDTFADWQVPTWVMVLVVGVLTISLVIGVPLARMAGTRRGRRLAHPELLTTKRQKAADTALFLAALVPSVLVWLAVMGVSFLGLTGFAARVMNWTHWTNMLVPLSLDGISVSFGAWAFVAVKRGRHPGRAYKIVLAAATMSAVLNFVHGQEEWSLWAGIYLAFLSFTGMAMFHELLEQFMAAYDEETALKTRYPRFGQRWLYAPISTFAARRAWIVNPPREPLRPSIRNALEHLEYVREERRLYRLGGATRVREEQQARLVEIQARMQVKAARRGDATAPPADPLLEPPPPLPDPAGDVLDRLRKELAPQAIPPASGPRQLPRRPDTTAEPEASTPAKTAPVPLPAVSAPDALTEPVAATEPGGLEAIEGGLAAAVAGPAAAQRPKRKTKAAARTDEAPAVLELGVEKTEQAQEGAPAAKRRTKAAAARAGESPDRPAGADVAAAEAAAAVRAAGDAEHERWRLEVPKSGWQRIGEATEGALAGLGGDGAVPLLFGASVTRPVLPERVPQILDAHVRPGDDLSVVRLTNLVLRSLAVPANRDAVSGLVRTWVSQIESGTRGYLDGPRPTPEPAKPFGPKLEYPFEVLTLQKVVINHRAVACPDCGTEESLMFSGQHKRRPVEASCGCGQRWPIVGLGSERVGEALANELALGQAELLRT